MTPHDIIAAFMAGMTSRWHDWRTVPRTPLPLLPDNDASRLLACLRKGGYFPVPSKPTAAMIAAGDAEVWRDMIKAWENELKTTARQGAIGFTELVNGREMTG